MVHRVLVSLVMPTVGVSLKLARHLVEVPLVNPRSRTFFRLALAKLARSCLYSSQSPTELL